MRNTPENKNSKLKRFIYILPFALLMHGSCLKESNASLSNANALDDGVYQKQIKQFKFILQPISANELVKLNYKNKELNSSEIKEIEKAYSDFMCFKFEILIEGFNYEITEYYDKDEREDYDKLINYYLFEMQKDLKLNSSDGEEVTSSIYSFERNFELVKSNRFIIGFKKPKSQAEITFSYDNKYLNIGKVNFQINKKDFLS